MYYLLVRSYTEDEFEFCCVEHIEEIPKDEERYILNNLINYKLVCEGTFSFPDLTGFTACTEKNYMDFLEPSDFVEIVYDGSKHERCKHCRPSYNPDLTSEEFWDNVVLGFKEKAINAPNILKLAMSEWIKKWPKNYNYNNLEELKGWVGNDGRLNNRWYEYKYFVNHINKNGDLL